MLVGRLREEDIELHVQPVSVSNLLAGVIEKMGSTGAAQNLTVRIQNEWPEEQMPLVDKFRITQVIENLVSNAIKFTAGVGSVTIHTQQEGSDWSVKVTDTGIGMAEADLARVFQRFYRADSAVAHEIPGVGSGLPISEAIVNAHNGEMGIDSTIGVGTTVWFKIPVQTLEAGKNSKE